MRPSSWSNSPSNTSRCSSGLHAASTTNVYSTITWFPLPIARPPVPLSIPARPLGSPTRLPRPVPCRDCAATVESFAILPLVGHHVPVPKPRAYMNPLATAPDLHDHYPAAVLTMP